MRTEVAEKMRTADMDAIMVVEQCGDYTSPEARDAWAAIDAAQSSGTAGAVAHARTACEKWIAANEAAAMEIINKRIRARQAELDDEPLSADILGM